jgi:hypothetical protein
MKPLDSMKRRTLMRSSITGSTLAFRLTLSAALVIFAGLAGRAADDDVSGSTERSTKSECWEPLRRPVTSMFGSANRQPLSSLVRIDRRVPRDSKPAKTRFNADDSDTMRRGNDKNIRQEEQHHDSLQTQRSPSILESVRPSCRARDGANPDCGIGHGTEHWWC